MIVDTSSAFFGNVITAGLKEKRILTIYKIIRSLFTIVKKIIIRLTGDTGSRVTILSWCQKGDVGLCETRNQICIADSD